MQLAKYFLIFLLFNNIGYANMKNAYDFKFKNIDDGVLNLSQFKGKAMLIANVASKCGFTKQYSGLQTIFDEYKDKGFIVIGVSSNDFKQELQNKEEVKKFCETNFGINFPMTDITKVKGNNAHPFYQWVKEQHGSSPKWNFYKILINKNGKIVDVYSSITKPDSLKIRKAIEQIL